MKVSGSGPGPGVLVAVVAILAFSETPVKMSNCQD